MEAEQTMQPPTAHLPSGAPLPTVDDPTAAGNLCGARRSPSQVDQDRARGVDQPWPWCGSRAGHGTDHPGIGRCRNHAGNTPNHRRNVQLRMAELVGPALETLARALVAPDVPWPTRRAAANDILSRSGYPARMEIDTDIGRERLHDRIMLWRAEQDQQTDDPEE